MKPQQQRTRLAVLCVCMMLALSACSDDTAATGTGTDHGADAGTDSADPDTGPDTNEGTATGLRLQGELAPTGGLSMSST